MEVATLLWKVTFYVMAVVPGMAPVQHHWTMPSLALCVQEVERTLVGLPPQMPDGSKIQAGCHLEPEPSAEAKT